MHRRERVVAVEPIDFAVSGIAAFAGSLADATLGQFHVQSFCNMSSRRHAAIALVRQHGQEVMLALRRDLRNGDSAEALAAAQICEILAWAAGPEAADLATELGPTLMSLAHTRQRAAAAALRAATALLYFTCQDARVAEEFFKEVVCMLFPAGKVARGPRAAAAAAAIQLLANRFEGPVLADFLNTHMYAAADACDDDDISVDDAYEIALAVAVAAEAAAEEGEEELAEEAREALQDPVRMRASEHNRAVKKRGMREQHVRFRALGKYLEDGQAEVQTVRVSASETAVEECDLPDLATQARYRLMVAAVGHGNLLRHAPHVREEFGLTAVVAELGSEELAQLGHQRAVEARRREANKATSRKAIAKARQRAQASAL